MDLKRKRNDEPTPRRGSESRLPHSATNINMQDMILVPFTWSSSDNQLGIQVEEGEVDEFTSTSTINRSTTEKLKARLATVEQVQSGVRSNILRAHASLLNNASAHTPEPAPQDIRRTLDNLKRGPRKDIAYAHPPPANELAAEAAKQKLFSADLSNEPAAVVAAIATLKAMEKYDEHAGRIKGDMEKRVEAQRRMDAVLSERSAVMHDGEAMEGVEASEADTGAVDARRASAGVAPSAVMVPNEVRSASMSGPMPASAAQPLGAQSNIDASRDPRRRR